MLGGFEYVEVLTRKSHIQNPMHPDARKFSKPIFRVRHNEPMNLHFTILTIIAKIGLSSGIHSSLTVRGAPSFAASSTILVNGPMRFFVAMNVLVSRAVLKIATALVCEIFRAILLMKKLHSNRYRLYVRFSVPSCW